MVGETTKTDAEAQHQSECPRVLSAICPPSMDLTATAVAVIAKRC